jgi:hypothetical protein
MEKEFIPYEQALSLEDLGFDEPCFGYYVGLGDSKEDPFKLVQIQSEKEQFQWTDNVYHAPLYQQAFRWFRLKYELDCSFEDDIVFDDDENEIEMWDFFIYKSKQVDDKVMKFCSNNFNTYIECFSKEEAELECLKKLIEIVKENK